MPIERINDYREDMKLSGPVGRVNCHYGVPGGVWQEGERESPRLSRELRFQDLNY